MSTQNMSRCDRLPNMHTCLSERAKNSASKPPWVRSSGSERECPKPSIIQPTRGSTPNSSSKNLCGGRGERGGSTGAGDNETHRTMCAAEGEGLRGVLKPRQCEAHPHCWWHQLLLQELLTSSTPPPPSPSPPPNHPPQLQIPLNTLNAPHPCTHLIHN